MHVLLAIGLNFCGPAGVVHHHGLRPVQLMYVHVLQVYGVSSWLDLSLLLEAVADPYVKFAMVHQLRPFELKNRYRIYK